MKMDSDIYFAISEFLNISISQWLLKMEAANAFRKIFIGISAENRHILVYLILKYQYQNNILSQATLALVLGVIICIFVYLIERYILKSEKAYEKAILLGLLSAEIMVFINNERKNNMATVTLLLFFYFHSVEH